MVFWIETRNTVARFFVALSAFGKAHLQELAVEEGAGLNDGLGIDVAG